MIYVTSDLHGRMDCMKKLLDYVHFQEDESNWLYILGDVIDRNGRGGVDILKWLLLQPNVQLILGNHEQMMLSNRWIFEEISEDNVESIDAKHLSLLSLWESNGGGCTMKAMAGESKDMQQDILAYLDDCPLYESVCVKDRIYVLVHSGLGNYARGKRMREYTVDELLWTRPTLETKYDFEKYTVILGHTPTCSYSKEYTNRMIRVDGWWNIDTGAALPDGRPMLLCLDNGKEYYLDENLSVTER